MKYTRDAIAKQRRASEGRKELVEVFRDKVTELSKEKKPNVK